jgi:hypothetical protein
LFPSGIIPASANVSVDDSRIIMERGGASRVQRLRQSGPPARRHDRQTISRHTGSRLRRDRARRDCADQDRWIVLSRIAYCGYTTRPRSQRCVSRTGSCDAFAQTPALSNIIAHVQRRQANAR